jgi:hypothetical protein
MPRVVFQDHGATWFMLAQHHGHLGCSHGSLMLVHVFEGGTCHVSCLCAWGMVMVVHGVGLHHTMDSWNVAMGVCYWSMGHAMLYLYALGITIVLHGLGLRNTVDTWAVAMGV